MLCFSTIFVMLNGHANLTNKVDFNILLERKKRYPIKRLLNFSVYNDKETGYKLKIRRQQS